MQEDMNQEYSRNVLNDSCDVNYYIDMSSKDVFSWKHISQVVDGMETKTEICRHLIRYMNKYFGYIKCYDSQKMAIVEKIYDEREQCVKLQVYNKETFYAYCANKNVSYRQGKKMTVCSIGKLYYEHPERREYQAIVYDPTYVQKFDYERDSPPGNVLNCYTGMKWTDKECRETYAIEKVRQDVETLRDMVYSVVCWENAEVFRYLESWWAFKFRHPEKKCGTMPLLVGPQGSGKTLYISLMLKMFGNNAERSETTEDLVGQFNNITENKLIIHLDEFYVCGSKEKRARLYSLITDDKARLEKKYRDRITTKSYTSFIASSNLDKPITLDQGKNRRIVFISCNPVLSKNGRVMETQEFIREFVEMTERDDNAAIKGYYHYLKNVLNLSSFPSTRHNFPVGGYQLAMQSSNLKGFAKWLETILSRGYHVKTNKRTLLQGTASHSLEPLNEISKRWARRAVGAVRREIGEKEQQEEHACWIRQVECSQLYECYTDFCGKRREKPEYTEIMFFQKLLLVFSSSENTSVLSRIGTKNCRREHNSTDKTECANSRKLDEANDNEILIFTKSFSVNNSKAIHTMEIQYVRLPDLQFCIKEFEKFYSVRIESTHKRAMRPTNSFNLLPNDTQRITVSEEYDERHERNTNNVETSNNVINNTLDSVANTGLKETLSDANTEYDFLYWYCANSKTLENVENCSKQHNEEQHSYIKTNANDSVDVVSPQDKQVSCEDLESENRSIIIKYALKLVSESKITYKKYRRNCSERTLSKPEQAVIDEQKEGDNNSENNRAIVTLNLQDSSEQVEVPSNDNNDPLLVARLRMRQLFNK